jgi:DUF177 domain-containing protein
MKIDLRPLRAERGGTLMVSFHEAVASGLDDVSFLAPVDGSLTLLNLGSTVRVDCNLTTVVELTCDRCARVFHQDLKATVHDDFDWATDVEGFLVVEGDTVTLDVDAMAREALVLELPMVSRCDPECKGLCDQCGADLRIEPCRCAHQASDTSERTTADPRLSPLAGWRRGDDAGRR